MLVQVNKKILFKILIHSCFIELMTVINYTYKDHSKTCKSELLKTEALEKLINRK